MHTIIAAILTMLVLVIGFCSIQDESFTIGENYIRGNNYQSGSGMLRGDLHIQPNHLGWFDSQYGPSSLAPGFFPTVTF